MSLTDLGAWALRQLDPETAHRLAIRALQMTPLPAPGADDPILKTTIAGLEMSNPVGLAAGLDKNGEALEGLSRLGFGAVECGSVTPRAQAGNPKPRLFRLAEDRAIINRMGFNNEGLEPFAARLARRPTRTAIGANLGANKDTEDKAADYVAGLRRLAGLADYFTVNISSPNTPGLRALQGREALDDLLGRIHEARPADGAPVFLKIAPDLIGEEIGMIVEASIAHRIDALIVSNTTLERPASLRSAYKGEAGGLSGAPLKPFAQKAVEAAAEAAGGRLPLIAVGGIADGADAYARIRAGASAVQVYSALIYEGPGMVGRIKRDLAARLRADGFASMAEATASGR
ncbi:Dihydroorotate dehydrogenase (quinone) [Brevundimonas diminuta]|jgi:dihydroorotate dehydrogenase|uniref:quinone-dependent dihydroorotate dehydrogenase n=1 Tax=Brevundimonas diminuta TaxID=293 RepID=UPI000207F3BB|nr:quinone-dependent dihydroorotate dehydrogenase [Brevundimonas diminuta]EGF95482.1 dihydroorotate oxidase [Brevundimonas diminuta ATCC 11568]OWR19793.1 dihydroorotate dehydrogenase (quinone) [Brevundimonas diminuta]WQE45708.1 quinone-dependent dihydroorotate dehydrogenase [Brevundimonas diminuta]SPU47317.1 Dihydroorotate dehydrogenase (quinone) [Brevundimonas diminuta]SUW14928.1 Dihydroorotate dehydrogenase (quinone) [Brevundimonas diminuta]